MRSPGRAWRWLLRKECCELVLSRSWWVMLGLTGPLVGLSFINAVRAYGEASCLGGTAAGLADAMWPLDGILAPTLSAYEVWPGGIRLLRAVRVAGGVRVTVDDFGITSMILLTQDLLGDMTRRTAAAGDRAVKLTIEPWLVEDEDRARLRQAGFSDRDIWDIAAVAAFYNMTNRLASATDMRPNSQYHAQGR